jgi:hypothetical protein
MDEKDPRKKGYIFESLIEILSITKCINGINFYAIKKGNYPSIHTINNIKDVLNKNIYSKEGGTSDVLLETDDGYLLPFSIKYKNTFLPSSSDVDSLETIFIKEKYTCYD